MDGLVRFLRRHFGRKYVPSWEQSPVEEAEQTGSEAVEGSGFYTSTASIVVYDLESLRHRVDDQVDWWADPEDEIEEINRRNVLIAGLQFDGVYDLEVLEEEGVGRGYSLRFPSGRVFVGPGDVITGGGEEPDESSDGIFVNLQPGDYKVWCARTDDQLRISLVRFEAFENAITEPITV